MKTITAIVALLLTSCAIGPDGKRHYIGPKIRGAITYRGIGLELTLFDPYNPTDTRTIDVTPDTPTGGKQPITP